MMEKHNFKQGDKVKTWWNEIGEITEVRTTKGLKPIVVNVNGKTEYYHIDQIVKIK